MTGENRLRNSAESMGRAARCLEEARALHAGGFRYGAVSRAYYAVFHAARALLFSVGLEGRGHKAIGRLLGQHFVRPGRLTAEMGRLVAKMQRDREDADYEGGAVFTDEQAREAVDAADRLLAEVRRILAAAGSRPPNGHASD